MTETTRDLDKLTAYVLARAEETAKRIIERAEKKAERIRAEGLKEAKAREEKIVRAAIPGIENEERQILSQAKLRLKGELLAAKARVIEDLLSGARERLERIRTEEKGYLDLLLSLVGRAISEEEAESVVVYLSEDDASRYGKELEKGLRKDRKLKGIDIKPSGISGGAIIEIPDKRLQIDASFEGLLSEIRGRIERIVEEEIFSPLEEREGENGDQG